MWCLCNKFRNKSFNTLFFTVNRYCYVTNIWWEREAKATELYQIITTAVLTVAVFKDKYMECLETRQKTLYVISYNDMILLKIMNIIAF